LGIETRVGHTRFFIYKFVLARMLEDLRKLTERDKGGQRVKQRHFDMRHVDMMNTQMFDIILTCQTLLTYHSRPFTYISPLKVYLDLRIYHMHW